MNEANTICHATSCHTSFLTSCGVASLCGVGNQPPNTQSGRLSQRPLLESLANTDVEIPWQEARGRGQANT